ncbi:hypothetical protein FAZ69_02800 [Trinickia terrae]|uniref:LysR substrate-binding domain-containing protein n=1 Tax=Trinickia terrae TaxID=2571161 RepID=A0A4U1IFT7_9BURK|nr:hypothetical protein FAZ69_02800 [Trinickia terrae]
MARRTAEAHAARGRLGLESNPCRRSLVCAPDYPCHQPLRAPDDVARAERLLHGQAEIVWIKWAARYGVNQAQALAGTRFERYSVLIQAAQAGLGVALVPRFLVRDNLVNGTLVEPPDVAIDVEEQGHYLCYQPERLESSSALRQLREWMLAEAGREGESAR